MQAFSSRINIPLLHEPHNDMKNGRFFVKNLPFLFPNCLRFVAERHRNDSFFSLPYSFYPEAPFRAGACPFTARHGAAGHGAAVLRRAAARSSFGRFQPRTGFAAHSIARRRRWKQTIRPNHPAGMAAAPIAQGYFTQKLP